jgi:cold shock CspA family protein
VAVTRQGTVSAYDEQTGKGRVLRDDGVEVSFDGGALAGSELRHLRAGQRVRWTDDGRVRDLQILTLH